MGATLENEPANGVRWQVGDHERRIKRLEEYDLGVLAERINRCNDSVQQQHAEMNALRRALYQSALTFAGGALIFSLTLFAIFR
jgi:hypothetical protein